MPETSQTLESLAVFRGRDVDCTFRTSDEQAERETETKTERNRQDRRRPRLANLILGDLNFGTAEAPF